MSDVPLNPPDGSTHAEHVTRDVRYFTSRRARCGDRSFIGIWLVAMGVIFLLGNLNIIEPRYIVRNFWPLLIVAWGGARLVSGRGGEWVAGVLALGFGGLLLGNRLLGWDINVMGLFWPLILIALGFSVLFRSSHRRPHAFPSGGKTSASLGSDAPDSIRDQAATLRETAIMAGVKRRSVSQAFRGGRVTTVMGSIDVDLRECRLADDSARIDVDAFMGQVVLRVPRDWAIDPHVSAIMGNVEDTSDRPTGSPSKSLILEGTVFMSQVEIRN